MLSVFLFVALIFGRALIVQSVLTVTLNKVDASFSDTQIAFTITDGGGNANNEYTVKRCTVSGCASGSVVDVAGGPFKLTDTVIDAGLTAETPYFYQLIRDDDSSGSQTSNGQATFTTLTALTDITVGDIDSTTAKFDWGDFADYSDHSVSVNGEPATAPTKPAYEVTGLTPSTANSIVFKGTKSSTVEALTLGICTAPNSPPTYTTKIESDGAETPIYTLTVNINVAAEDKVSNIAMFFGTAIDVASAPTACDQTSCTDCESCVIDKTTANTLKWTTVTTAGPKYSVVWTGYTKEQLETGFKITAEYKDATMCTKGGTIDAVSLANTVYKEALLVYLVIGTMATVLRLL